MTRALPIVRTGLPLPGGRLVTSARDRQMPVLFSANAFARVYPRGHEWEGDFKEFRLPNPEQFRGLDAALDSAGFVAAVRYGGYRWSVEEYFDLVCAHPWTWYASMDYCCEPEIASDRPLRLLRMAATSWKYARCSIEAKRRGVRQPMPVLQGWRPDEYAMSVDWMPIIEWPELVGVGSVCRRRLHGPNGLHQVIAALDAALPAHVRLHLFGVKSQGLAALANHPRVASVDSMAWDAAARRERKTGRDMDFRIEHMKQWTLRQKHQMVDAARGGGVQNVLFLPMLSEHFSDDTSLVLEALAHKYAELIMDGDITYRTAVRWAQHDAYEIEGMLLRQTIDDEILARLEDVFGGLAEQVERLLHKNGSVTGRSCGNY